MACRAANAAYHREYRSQHREKVAAITRKHREGRRREIKARYKAAHPEAWADEQARSSHRRRARKHGAQAERVDRSVVYARDHGRCVYCHRTAGEGWHLAHLVALSRGGSHSYSNVAVSCPECNERDGVGRLTVQLRMA